MTAAPPPRVFRLLQVVIPGVLFLWGLATLATPHPFPFAGILFGMGVIAIVAFAWRRRLHTRNLARVRDALARVGATEFDAPADVHDGVAFESTIYGRAFAGRTTRLCVSGSRGGRALELGTAIIASRDADLFVSYAIVRDAAVRAPFRAMSRGATATMLRVGMRDKQSVETGDARFDAKWIVDADSASTRAVLDAPLRAKLTELAGSFGVFQMGSIEAGSTGVIVRLPGVMTPELAAQLREVATTVQERLART